MYRQGYAEILDDSSSATRSSEREAFERALALLRAAQPEGPRSREGIEALHFVHRLWTLLMEDLASPQNDLPKELRAGLISTGIWVLREVDSLRRGESDDLPGLIEMHEIILKGLG